MFNEIFFPGAIEPDEFIATVIEDHLEIITSSCSLTELN